MKIVDVFVNNFWIKLFSLVLAIATWFYVFDLLQTGPGGKKETIEQVCARYNFIAKEVPVRLVYSGRSPEGYRVIFEKVKISPSTVTIFGPEDIVNAVNELRTDSIDLGEYTHSVKLSLSVQTDVKALKLADKIADVYLPVEQNRPERQGAPEKK
jgi:YbbR domain-containing protein